MKDAGGERLCSGKILPIRFTVGTGGTIITGRGEAFNVNGLKKGSHLF